MSSVLALFTAAPGAVLTAAALDSAAAAVASAASTVIINGEGPYDEFWSKIPSTPSSYTVAAGTVLSFRYTSGHNVWLMPTEKAFNDCDFSVGISHTLWLMPTEKSQSLNAFSAAVELASQTYGGGQPPIWPNDYQAVATTAGDLLIACQAVMGSHCGRGQKIRVTVTEQPPSPPPSKPAVFGPLTPDGEESGAPPQAKPARVRLAASFGAAAAAYLVLRHSRQVRWERTQSNYK